jgi:hypothetical protein
MLTRRAKARNGQGWFRKKRIREANKTDRLIDPSAA